MKTHVRAAVIGGGVVGASVLYHLTKAGWTDVCLVERAELTSGSTWHAAGGMHTVNGDPNIAKLQSYTINLYREIERISGQSCGIHLTKGLMLAATPERHDFLKLMVARARYLGLDMRMMTPEEAGAMCPILDPSHFVGALHNTLEGHVDPSGVTFAYAKCAQMAGAEIYRHTRVVETRPRPDGAWDVVTERGTIVAEHVVNAGGLWAREVGRMAGLELPVLAMEHQYLVTDEIPEVAAASEEIIHIIDFDGEIYMRQEGKGMLIGTYEPHGVPWSARVTPWDFGQDLLAPDLDRISANLETGFRHFPPLGRAGIKRIVNGPFTFTPDGNPLVGPVRGLKNYWVACGVMAGLSQGGGVGLAVSNWMVEGEAGMDIWGMDVARYGDWTTPAYTRAKVVENYGRRFRVRYPGEELPAGRPLRTTPVYRELADAGAVFGATYGLEYPLWFAPAGTPREEHWQWRRTNAHGVVAGEVEAVRNRVGLMEISTYAKHEVSGPGAEAFLARVLAGRLPAEGRIALSPMLFPSGKLAGDFTVSRLGPTRFMIIGAGQAEDYQRRWFEAHMPTSGVSLRTLGLDLVGLSIAGPRSRELLAAVSGEDCTSAGFPFMSIREMQIGLVPALVGRISYTGDIGYEIWVRPEHQVALLAALRGEGAALGVALFGARALNALRLEKGYGSWRTEYRPIYTAFEAGLDRLLDLRRGGFIGCQAALRQCETVPARKLVLLDIDVMDADAVGDEPVSHDGRVVGWVTSGGYAHNAGRSLAFAYVTSEVADETIGFTVEILGIDRPARRLPRPPFDPDGVRLRS
ncbi:MAG: FAD-dependent oxidoreductase [Hyphomicrobiaceae bacterium]